VVFLPKGEVIDRQELLVKLIDIQYQRNDIEFQRGKFRVRGDTIEVWPSTEEVGYRIELFGDEVDRLSVIHPLTGEIIKELDQLHIFPAKHFVTPEDRVREAIKGIEAELGERLEQFKTEGKLLEAERLKARTRYDLDMLREVGYCSGVENYARWFSGRPPGEPPYTLIDFFPEDFLLVVDESHVSLPQVRGMYHGDFARKTTLVEHGFRLPSAMDNRPLRFEEFEKRLTKCLCLSATPGPYELEKTGGEVVEQFIRPTGLVDPLVHVRSAKGQVKNLEEEVRLRVAKQERTLVTVLTKRMAEDLTNYFKEAGLRCKWLHSELDAIERITVLRELREGAFDVLVGVNLLREGLDLPEVSLVAILDADKEGFLRSDKSLIQTMGRAARNVNAEVILYADRVTDSMSRAMNETGRRREMQLAYNVEHNITPRSVMSAIRSSIEDEIEAMNTAQEVAGVVKAEVATAEMLEALHKEMMEAAEGMEFEKAALLRDKIAELKGEKVASAQGSSAGTKSRRKGPTKEKPLNTNSADTVGGGFPRRPPRPKANG
jgi:excinuclease ABC subunit B